MRIFTQFSHHAELFKYDIFQWELTSCISYHGEAVFSVHSTWPGPLGGWWVGRHEPGEPHHCRSMTQSWRLCWRKSSGKIRRDSAQTLALSLCCVGRAARVISTFGVPRLSTPHSLSKMTSLCCFAYDVIRIRDEQSTTHCFHSSFFRNLVCFGKKICALFEFFWIFLIK